MDFAAGFLTGGAVFLVLGTYIGSWLAQLALRGKR